MRKLFFCLMLSCIANWTYGQASADSENPPSIRWMQIKNENSTIIYPKGLESYANKFAATIDHLDKNNKTTIGPKVTPIPIILHGKSMEGNGFVASVPFRSEIYTTPIANWNILGQNNWLDALAIHEYRHVLQNSNADVGFSKLARFITGRGGWSAVLRFTDPAWFAEGDAVMTESLLTEAGRGRMASFTADLRANLYAGKHFSYNKSRNGSYKTKMPNHYPFGYVLNLYARKTYGDDVWSKVIHDANFLKPPFYPFSGAIKRHTGLSAKKLYKAAYADFEMKTEALIHDLDVISFDSLSTAKTKSVVNYIYPKTLADGSLIARKSGFSVTPKLIKWDINGKESTLSSIGISNNPYISYAEKGALWLENQTNPRWANVDFARVVYYDFATDTKRMLKDADRYFYAALSPSAEEFMTIILNEDLVYELTAFNTQTGEKKNDFSNEENWDLAYPIYSNDGMKLFYVARKDGKLAIVKHDLANDQKELLTNWMNAIMVELSESVDDIYFRGNFTGIDNIYKVSKSGDKRLYKVSSVPVGAGYPSFNNRSNTILFSNLTDKGYHLASMDLTDVNFQEVTTNLKENTDFFNDLNNLPENGSILDNIKEQNYQAEPYKGFLRGWNFHSWGVLPAFGSSENSALPSLASSNFFLNMDDILGANSLVLNYTRYITEGENAYGIDYVMAKYFAKFNVAYEYRGRKVEAAKGNRILEFDEQEATIGLNVPLEMIKGNYVWNTNVVANWKGIQQFRSDNFFEFVNSKFGLYELKGGVSVNRQKAYKNLQSKLGGSVSLSYAESFQTGIAKMFRAGANILLPGIGVNHGLEIQQAYYDESNKNLYRFPNTFSLGRGHSIFGIQNAYRTSINYKMPLLYPDLGINGITYVKRLRMNLYFDTTHAKDSGGETDLRTAGAEFLFDQTVFNLFDLPIGLRVGYRFPNKFLPNLKSTYINLIIGG